MAWYHGERIELRITKSDAQIGSHQGDCEDDVRWLLKKPYIAKQMAEFDDATVAFELKGYGAWDDDELADREMNEVRLLWLACGQIVDEMEGN